MDWVIRIFGLFYVAGSVLLVRQLALDAVAGKLEQALYGQATRDRVRHYWLRVGAALTLSSGLGMILTSTAMMPLLIANCIVQGGWLLYARSQFPPEGADEAMGRRQTTNAFIGLMVITALAGWAVASGAVVLFTEPAGTLWPAVATWLPVAGGVAVLVFMLVG